MEYTNTPRRDIHFASSSNKGGPNVLRSPIQQQEMFGGDAYPVISSSNSSPSTSRSNTISAYSTIPEESTVAGSYQQRPAHSHHNYSVSTSSASMMFSPTSSNASLSRRNSQGNPPIDENSTFKQQQQLPPLLTHHSPHIHHHHHHPHASHHHQQNNNNNNLPSIDTSRPFNASTVNSNTSTTSSIRERLHHQGSLSMDMSSSSLDPLTSHNPSLPHQHHHHGQQYPHLQGQANVSYPYSPMASVSPSSPKVIHNPWASPLGSPLSHQPGSPSRHQRQLSQGQQQQQQHQQQQQQQQQQMYAHASPRPPVQRSQEMRRRASPPPRQLHPQQRPMAQTTIPAPTFRHVRSKSELTPVIYSQPKYRRALPEGGFLSPLCGLTLQLSSTYQICNPAFSYQSSKNPRRVLTKPSEGKLNNGFDNADSDYILYVNDILGIDEQRRYLVLDILGQGTFGQVVKCQNMITKEIVAVKVIKNKPAYLNQSMMEVSILEHLNSHVDKKDEHNLLRLKDKFIHKEHLCLVFELLSSNLYELIKQNQFRGLSTNLVRVFAQQLLDSLIVLKEARLIHCDMKPENILLKSLDSPVIKVIDFGSACHERQTVYTYIQSRFYRSPEVLLGLPYTTSIDMWSLGCIVAELFLGLPIFPGTSEYNQLCRITDTLGYPPNWMCEMGKNTSQFMDKYVDEFGRKQYRLKSREKYSRENKCDEQPSKQYFPSTNLREIIMNYPPPRRNMKKIDIDREMANRVSFVDFVQGLLNLNPFERWTPQQAMMHPFITESKFVGPYVPSLIKQPQPQSQSQHTQQQQQHAPHSQHIPSLQVQPPQSRSQPQAHHHQPQIQHQVQPFNNVPSIKVQSDGFYNNGSIQQQQQQMPYRSIAMGSTQNTSNAAAHLVAAHAVGSHSTRRPRATTIGNLDAIPNAIQRATALMNSSEPIRAQPSPAYIPPPDLYQAMPENSNHPHQSRRSQGQQYGDVVRNLEDGLSY